MREAGVSRETGLVVGALSAEPREPSAQGTRGMDSVRLALADAAWSASYWERGGCVPESELRSAIADGCKQHTMSPSGTRRRAKDGYDLESVFCDE